MARCPACMNRVSRRDLLRTKGWWLHECKSCGERLKPHQWLFYLHISLSVATAVAVQHILEPYVGGNWRILVVVPVVMLVVIFVLVPLQKLERCDAAT